MGLSAGLPRVPVTPEAGTLQNLPPAEGWRAVILRFPASWGWCSCVHKLRASSSPSLQDAEPGQPAAHDDPIPMQLGGPGDLRQVMQVLPHTRSWEQRFQATLGEVPESACTPSHRVLVSNFPPSPSSAFLGILNSFKLLL